MTSLLDKQYHLDHRQSRLCQKLIQFQQAHSVQVGIQKIFYSIRGFSDWAYKCHLTYALDFDHRKQSNNFDIVQHRDLNKILQLIWKINLNSTNK